MYYKGTPSTKYSSLCRNSKILTTTLIQGQDYYMSEQLFSGHFSVLISIVVGRNGIRPFELEETKIKRRFTLIVSSKRLPFVLLLKRMCIFVKWTSSYFLSS